MQSHPSRAPAPIHRLRGALGPALLLAVLAVGTMPGHALWNQSITAYRVADKSIKMDGRPDSVWRAISVFARSDVGFGQYGKMVILQPDSVRNADPEKYLPSPPSGSATFLAAYDSEALYFYFAVKPKATVAHPGTLGCGANDWWKADAAEVWVDPSPWSEDPGEYRSYFTADASGLVYGTSPKSIQLAKPIHHQPDSTRYYFRNRVTADKFQIPGSTNPAIQAISARQSTSAGAWRGVEMKIPFWTPAANFAAGKSMFVSWGFNLYLDTLPANCSGMPLAYRWAKHTYNYDGDPEKPPGWRAKDTTHYDPSRSWDGWGRLTLTPSTLDGRTCRYQTPAEFNASWDPDAWRSNCSPPVTASVPRRYGIRLDGAGMPVPSGLRREGPGRDARGRSLPSGSRAPAFNPR